MIRRLREIARDLPAEPDSQAETDAARRALPMQRLVGNGMDHDDAALLHARAAAGVPWPDAAEAIAEAALMLAQNAAAARRLVSARTHFWHAAASFRFAHSPLIRDEPRKIALYRRSLDAFAEGAALAAPPYAKVAIPFGPARLQAWLMMPRGALKPPPVVIVFGGADGTREEYHRGALELVERGIAALLLDGPGQGETRLLGNVYLRPGIERAFSAAVDFLLADDRVGNRVGIWGNSLGGCFAARTASTDPRLDACCVTGGTWAPGEILTRFPRFIERILAMTAESEPDRARAILEAHTLAREQNRIACPLLVLHGAADRLFSADRAVELADWAPSPDKQVVLWEDGDHCVYNHTTEKHCMVAEWFSDRLGVHPAG